MPPGNPFPLRFRSGGISDITVTLARSDDTEDDDPMPHNHDDDCAYADNDTSYGEKCGDQSPDNRWTCTLATGHNGPHIACNDRRHFIAAWVTAGYVHDNDRIAHLQQTTDAERREQLNAVLDGEDLPDQPTTYKIDCPHCIGATREQTDNDTQLTTTCDTCGRKITGIQLDSDRVEQVSRITPYK